MKKKVQKLNKLSGFTLAETLVAVLILLMVSSVVAAGIPAAKSAYERVVLVSNAEVLLSTTISTLRNELGTATNVKTVGSDGVVYYNESIKGYAKIYKEGNIIKYQRYAAPDESFESFEDPNSQPVNLISEKASTQGLNATYSAINYSDGIITFSGLSVYKGAKELTKRDNEDVSFRVISYSGNN